MATLKLLKLVGRGGSMLPRNGEKYTVTLVLVLVEVVLTFLLVAAVFWS